MKPFWVKNLDTTERHLYLAKTPYDAMRKLIYTLKLRHHQNLEIDVSASGLHLYVDAVDGTWVVRNA